MNAHLGIFKETLAILVIYENVPNQSSTYLSLENTLKRAGAKMDLFIYDNSFLKHDAPASENWSVLYEHDPTNGGVSKAYNRGCRVAESLKKKWLWLLDQDDVFDEQALHAYQTSFNQNPDVNLFAPIVVDQKSTICSPFRKRFGGGWRIKTITPGVYPLLEFLLINSGLFISVSAFENAGGYEEDFPLDFSDLDFIQRLKIKYDQFVIIPTTVQHSLSINSELPLEKRLIRFRSYLKAATLFKKKYDQASRSILLRSFFMAGKLSLRHSSLKFMREYFQIWY